MSGSLIGPPNLAALLSLRAGERRLGELVGGRAAKWALVGIAEDIGVRANLGRGGTAAMWPVFLRRFLALPARESFTSNVFTIAGEVEVASLQEASIRQDPARPAALQHLRVLTAQVDELVANALADVLRRGSIPIVIGGGHNNALGISRALRQVHGCAHGVINCDAHADLRDMEGRHSGNPFTYAMSEGSLGKYAVVGFSPVAANAAILARLDGRRARAWSVDDIHADRVSIAAAASQARQFIGDGPWSLEIDLDCVAGVPCSATSASGIGAGQLRALVRAILASGRAPAAVHICEGVPKAAASAPAPLLWSQRILGILESRPAHPIDDDPAPRLAAELVMDIIGAGSH